MKVCAPKETNPELHVHSNSVLETQGCDMTQLVIVHRSGYT